MDFISILDRSTIEGLSPIAESDQFAMYAVGDQTYLLVQRHEGTPWVALRFSGDGVFRVGSLVVEAMRHLYRDVAAQLSPSYEPIGATSAAWSRKANVRDRDGARPI